MLDVCPIVELFIVVDDAYLFEALDKLLEGEVSAGRGDFFKYGHDGLFGDDLFGLDSI